MLELLVHPTTEKHADARFLPPTPADAEALTPDDMHHALTVEMTPDNLEVIVVGDFDEAELERCLCSLSMSSHVSHSPPWCSVAS